MPVTLGKKAQTACKPGSVPPFGFSSHSSATCVATRLMRRTRNADKRQSICVPYSVLLPAGFTMRAASPKPRWALTPPFHPYPGSDPGRFTFCGTFPRLAPGGRYPPPCLRGARTFLQQASLPATAQPSGDIDIDQLTGNRQSRRADGGGLAGSWRPGGVARAEHLRFVWNI